MCIDPADSLFALRSVTISFDGQSVLQDVDLSIARGQITVIIGPSGCGKTVLLKHLIGLLQPDSGQVWFDGQRIDRLREVDLLFLRKRCGYLFQAGALFDSYTVAENVALPLRLHGLDSDEHIHTTVHEKLDMVGLTGLGDRMPSELSGGQYKRVALARAIVFSPEVMLYDEPTTGLDPIRSAVIDELVLRLQRSARMSSIVVTHDIQSVRKIADRVIMLHGGRIIADGTVAAIEQHPDLLVQDFIHRRPDGHGVNGLAHR